jgi:hypothetical protein
MFNKEMKMTKEYELALEASRKASREFAEAQTAYRARNIGDAEFLAAKAKHDAACKEFDAAYDAEVNR